MGETRYSLSRIMELNPALTLSDILAILAWSGPSTKEH